MLSPQRLDLADTENCHRKTQNSCGMPAVDVA